MLYGLFVDFILEDKSRFNIETYDLAKTAHGENAFYGEELEKFISNLDPHAVALGFQSSARFDNKVLEDIYSEFKNSTQISSSVFS